MNIEEIRDYCLSKPCCEECMPFDDTTIVFKVGGKMFALMALDSMRLNLKCEPVHAQELREQYASFLSAGWHMSKKHWNTIRICDAVPAHLLRQWIDDSYTLIAASLTKKLQVELFGVVVESIP